jgi:hypothetical protein
VLRRRVIVLSCRAECLASAPVLSSGPPCGDNIDSALQSRLAEQSAASLLRWPTATSSLGVDHSIFGVPIEWADGSVFFF